MLIFLKNKQTLNIDEFSFKCCIGKKGSTNNKKEGDFKTPKGIFNLGNLYYRADREKKLLEKEAVFFFILQIIIKELLAV